MEKKRFRLGQILAIVSGLSAGGKDFAGVQEIFDFLEVDDPPVESGFEAARKSKRQILLRQFPQLANCESDFTANQLKILKTGTDQAAIQDILSQWTAWQIAKYGEWHEVSPR